MLSTVFGPSSSSVLASRLASCETLGRLFSTSLDSAMNTSSPSTAPPTSSGTTALVWFHTTDLRTHDHEPLATAFGVVNDGMTAYPLFKNGVGSVARPVRARVNRSRVPEEKKAPSTSAPPPGFSTFASHVSKKSKHAENGGPAEQSSPSPSSAALSPVASVLPVFVFDPRFLGKGRSPFGFQKSGPLRARFLCQSVLDLRNSLRSMGSDLLIRVGDPELIIPEIASSVNASAVYSYSEWTTEELEVEALVADELKKRNVGFRVCWGGTMVHLSDLPFRIENLPATYTQFRIQCEKNWKLRPSARFTLRQDKVAKKLPQVVVSGSVPAGELPSSRDLGYEQPPSEFDKRAVLPFTGGESVALSRLKYYIWDKELIKTYKETRNGLIGGDYSSKFSPWLAHGCISPIKVYEEVNRYEQTKVQNDSTYWLIFELLWRDYFRFYSLHFGRKMFFPYGPRGVPPVNVQPKDQRGPEPVLTKDKWSRDPELVQAWVDGMTGHPFVDANMRELKLTGFMSNRGRQNVASFFVKDMECDWRIGAEYFESMLLDYDVASNWGNWNYVAGVGADPREGRYFNIEKQASMYDAQHEYRKLWVPEIAQRNPFNLASSAAAVATYPKRPIVPLKFSFPGAAGKEKPPQRRGNGNGSGYKRIVKATRVGHFAEDD